MTRETSWRNWPRSTRFSGGMHGTLSAQDRTDGQFFLAIADVDGKQRQPLE
jgi:hypothetical protein